MGYSIDLKKYFSTINEFLPGNEIQLKLVTSALISGKHCLIEDIPGKGKTLLAKYLGKNFDLSFKRIQCTNDLMPSDIVGFHQWKAENLPPTLRHGPLFTDVLLVDEINRASPRTQSSLLQAMEEKLVTLDDQTYELSSNFCVLATQNPQDHVGTTPLPESQIDRFLYKFTMGTLTYNQELNLLQSGARHDKIKNLVSLFTKENLISLKIQLESTKISNTIFQWITHCLQYSRTSNDVHPLSSRAGLDFVIALKSWSIIHERNEVVADDFIELFPYCFAHRLFMGSRDHHGLLIQKTHEWLKQIKF